MYFITAFGCLMIIFSLNMIINPKGWSKKIVSFSYKPYFHWFEVGSRAISGVLFVLFHTSVLYPKVILFMGYLFISVSIGLIFIGPTKHQKFALWSAYKFQKSFQISGCFSLVFGIFLIYISTFSSL